MIAYPFPKMDIVILVATLIIVIKGINLGFKILHRFVDKRMPARQEQAAEPR